jgi:hypothetical protein
MSTFRKRLLISGGLLLISIPVIAEPIFKWTAPDGHIVYASKPPSPDSKPALLPPIVKADIKLTDKAIENCSSHGGIDCGKGGDPDGSVICADGFKDALTRFKTYCAGGKLFAEHILEVKREQGATTGILTVQVRNATRLPAKGIIVQFTARNGDKLKLEGPTEIEALSSAEYTYAFQDIQGLTTAELKALTPPKEKISISKSS